MQGNKRRRWTPRRCMLAIGIALAEEIEKVGSRWEVCRLQFCHREEALFLSCSFCAMGVPARITADLLSLGEESRVEVGLVSCH